MREEKKKLRKLNYYFISFHFSVFFSQDPFAVLPQIYFRFCRAMPEPCMNIEYRRRRRRHVYIEMRLYLLISF